MIKQTIAAVGTDIAVGANTISQEAAGAFAAFWCAEEYQSLLHFAP